MHMEMEKSFNSPLYFVFGWWWCRLVLLFWVWISATQAQQSYVNDSQFNCENHFKEADGFQCNGPRSCLSYLTFRSAPPYDSPRSISSLLNSDPAQIASISQHNASYTVNASDTYFSIANNIYQGLTTCQALKAQNPSHNSRGHLSEDIDLLIPLRCACPVDVLISSGYNYLLSYIINMGENISSIAQTFHVEKWAIYAANDLPYSDEQIFSSTALLIPLKDPPTAFQTRRTSNCVPNDALLYEIF
ncbi:hypothetical protein VitviT2T_023221 [Vitis vinifera]|uniref:LysM domain-containing protein n=1 Tax=Vitis vinifera TaxID=29760 RepID=A0ABY9DC39_VITVI|nr:hypothetical protein VitviT2T_023221 [Vitis vinifera]